MGPCLPHTTPLPSSQLPSSSTCEHHLRGEREITCEWLQLWFQLCTQRRLSRELMRTWWTGVSAKGQTDLTSCLACEVRVTLPVGAGARGQGTAGRPLQRHRRHRQRLQRQGRDPLGLCVSIGLSIDIATCSRLVIAMLGYVSVIRSPELNLSTSEQPWRGIT